MPFTSATVAGDILKLVAENIRTGEKISRSDAFSLSEVPTGVLTEASELVTREFASRTFNFCAIVNAKSGNCSEDCAWCSQSRRFSTNAPQYPIIAENNLMASAEACEKAGVKRFSLVTSGRKLSRREVRESVELVKTLRRNTNLELCMSSGLLTREELEDLYKAGVTRYHCNLESSREYFPSLCSSHTTDDKIATLKNARSVGMQICSGGIIGMGESEQDRISLALTLCELDVPSIPINILSPIRGTALENTPPISDEDILRTVAIFRIINPKAYLRFAGGRARICSETQLAAMRAGINSAISGDMLTTSGTALANDRELVAKAGYRDEREDPRCFDREHIWHPYAGTVNPPATECVASGSGCRIILDDGRELIDGTSSWWCALFGYGHPELIAAVKDQVEKISHVMFAGFTHKPVVELTRKLLAILPKGIQHVFYGDSGSVAVEIAMKMAVQYQYAKGFANRSNFVTLSRGYHGDTWNAMSVCDPENGMHTMFGSSLPVRFFLPSPTSTVESEWDPKDLEPLAKLLEEKGSEIAAFILEPIVQGAGAMRFYHPEYIREAQKLCREHGVLLIADEIATGFGRTGKKFACDWVGVTPDIMTIGKGLTAGMITLAATATTNEVADTISRSSPGALMHGPTFMANPLACAAACASLDLFEKFDWQGAVSRIESTLKKRLEPLRSLPGVVDVRAFGAIGVVELDGNVDSSALMPEFVRRGVWIRPFSNLFYVMPPFVITDEELGTLMDAFEDVLKWWLAVRK